jgi:hypothetical protein
MKNGVFWNVTPCGSCKNLELRPGVNSTLGQTLWSVLCGVVSGPCGR